MTNRLIYFYPIILFLYSIYSYTQVVPNLILSSSYTFWDFQQFMWQIGYHNRPLSSYLYVAIMIAMFGCYWLIMKSIKNNYLTFKKALIMFGLCIAALTPSYTALSSDIFNYIMNAKMMHVYNASPYSHAAWDFTGDPLLSFMMNIHTTTPYGYVWTALGYLTYFLSFGSLQLGMLAFRMLATLAVIIVGWGIYMISDKDKLWRMGYFIFNPLVLLEAVNNAHNDIMMMAFFIAGIAIWIKYRRQKIMLAGLFLVVNWVLSVYTKLVTVVTPAIFVFYYAIRKHLPWFNWADITTFALIAGMYADGSKRFFPWYFLWPISIAALAKSDYTIRMMTIFSITAVFSYIFYLYTGEYSQTQGMIRLIFLFSLPVIYSGWTLIRLARLGYANISSDRKNKSRYT